MEQLIQMLKELLSDMVVLKFKAHGYHWNVEGDDFPQWHDKFAEIYESLDDSIDPLAEWIRMLGDYAPFKLTRFEELSAILNGLPYLTNPIMVHLSDFYTDEASLLI